MFVFDFQDMVTISTGYLRTSGIRNNRCYYKRPPQAPQEEVLSPTSSLYVILLFYLLSYLCILSWMH